MGWGWTGARRGRDEWCAVFLGGSRLSLGRQTACGCTCMHRGVDLAPAVQQTPSFRDDVPATASPSLMPASYAVPVWLK